MLDAQLFTKSSGYEFAHYGAYRKNRYAFGSRIKNGKHPGFSHRKSGMLPDINLKNGDGPGLSGNSKQADLLIDLEDGSRLWPERCERELNNI